MFVDAEGTSKVTRILLIRALLKARNAGVE
jgi:hypothetical protein